MEQEMTYEIIQIRDLHVIVWLHTEVDPPAVQWDPALAAIGKVLASLDLAKTRGFVVSDGGSPSARQRSMLQKEILGGYPQKASVITTVLSNPIKRGVATALRWINPSYGFFEPHEARRALAHVDLASDLAPIWQSFGKLQARLRASTTLRLIATALDLPPLK